MKKWTPGIAFGFLMVSVYWLGYLAFGIWPIQVMAQTTAPSGSVNVTISSQPFTPLPGWGMNELGPYDTVDPQWTPKLFVRYTLAKEREGLALEAQAAMAADPKNTAGWYDQRYLANNPDVAGGVKTGAFISGLDHYIHYGQTEGRRYW